MREKPDLYDETIAACVRASYDIPAVSVEFLPVGNDATAWSYRVLAADGRAYFLKLRRGKATQNGLAVSDALADLGIVQAVAPIMTLTGALWARVEPFSLTLYPFVEGRAAMEVGLSLEHWTRFGRLLATIHAAQLPPQVLAQIQTEGFASRWLPAVERLQRQIDEGGLHDTLDRELASFWRASQPQITMVLERCAALGRALQGRGPAIVLCHADIHTANLLVGADERLLVVDWDDALLAPRERDLMFVVGDTIDGVPISANAQQAFFHGYGAYAVDPLALAYYRYEWVVQELGDNGARILQPDDWGEETRRAALASFVQLFAPGDVVAAAFASDVSEDCNRSTAASSLSDQ